MKDVQIFFLQWLIEIMKAMYEKTRFSYLPISSSELDSSTVGGIWWLDTFAFFRSDSASVAGDDTFGIWNHKINSKITIRRELFFQIDD